jgi:uncharacterized protein (DUF2235 family)
MSKNLVLCCDGTCNEFGATPNNVVRVFQSLDLSDPAKQVGYYDPGVGTMGEPGMVSKTGKRITQLLGAGVGLGITANVIDACRFLMLHWEPGDRIFLFGFSRGAFTARIVAAMIEQAGILRPGLENLLPYAVRLYRKSFAKDGGNQVMAEFKRTFGQPARITYLGLWDTVSSVGAVWAPVGWPGTATNAAIDHARHAMAIDERRGFYRQNRMKPVGAQAIEQRWYPGVHSDVGGGYSVAGPGSNTLWSAPFTWIADGAVAAGMIADPAALNAARLPVHGLPHSSLKWYWWPLELFPKLRWEENPPHSGNWSRRPHLNRGQWRRPKSGEHLSPTVADLFAASSEWNPRGLANAGVTRATIGTLQVAPDGSLVVP